MVKNSYKLGYDHIINIDIFHHESPQGGSRMWCLWACKAHECYVKISTINHSDLQTNLAKYGAPPSRVVSPSKIWWYNWWTMVVWETDGTIPKLQWMNLKTSGHYLWNFLCTMGICSKGPRAVLNFRAIGILKVTITEVFNQPKRRFSSAKIASKHNQ